MHTGGIGRTDNDKDGRFPSPASESGWVCLDGEAEIRESGGFDPIRLERLAEVQVRLCAGNAFGVCIVRHGVVVAELNSVDYTWGSRFDIHSCSKSLTSLAWGMLLDDQRRSGGDISLTSSVYDIIGTQRTDPRKQDISLFHLLSMTSGIVGEQGGIWGHVTDATHGPYEFALGLAPNRSGQWAKELAGAPGTRWDYSDAAYTHLGLAFPLISGQEMAAFLEERLFSRIGTGVVSWDAHGGEGHLGPHTTAVSGVHISARDLARVGLLLLRRGSWEGQTVVPEWWIEQATKPSQVLNPAYGLGFWVNQQLAYHPGAPRDMFLMAGYRANRCYIVPSLDLVVARVGSGPLSWDERQFVDGVLNAVV